MPLLLNIDTATEHASVCISKNGKVIALEESTEQKNHASFIQPAVAKLMGDNGLRLTDLDAVAVTIGPGSYTGLRVGLASAKGICYALNKPLLTLNTLQVMARGAMDHCLLNSIQPDSTTLFCPLIDARRMEVFTAVYDSVLNEIQPPHALIIDEHAFESLYTRQPVIFSGSGRTKLRSVLTNPHISYLDIQHNASHMVTWAGEAYRSGNFVNLAYCEPLYVKEFFDPSRNR